MAPLTAAQPAHDARAETERLCGNGAPGHAAMRFVGGYLRGGVRRQPALRVLVVGCSDHTHSLVHEARAVAAERVLAGLDTKVVVVNPSSEGAALLGDGAEQVSCEAEDFFLSR